MLLVREWESARRGSWPGVVPSSPAAAAVWVVVVRLLVFSSGVGRDSPQSAASVDLTEGEAGRLSWRLGSDLLGLLGGEGPATSPWLASPSAPRVRRSSSLLTDSLLSFLTSLVRWLLRKEEVLSPSPTFLLRRLASDGPPSRALPGGRLSAATTSECSCRRRRRPDGC